MTDIIEEIQQIQRQTEEMYIQGQDSELILLKSCETLDLSEEKDE
ncbi:hypothetical protein DOT_4242 [Desulfosporosinus sp. OT]|nr:hypothetical protein DOT_4242 [Desulfosporosinus sp. OT]